ncbi:hypothetical protein [Streptomyces sp. ICN441]|uniref:hypothetical protein n=1 Tax=Streptomyces sp. ICN441 TaxID=2558286 RepID=UPI001F0F672A|nr:hypothetical protein [Streptomyces sp. ICN441]
MFQTQSRGYFFATAAQLLRDPGDVRVDVHRVDRVGRGAQLLVRGELQGVGVDPGGRLGLLGAHGRGEAV